MHGAAVQCAIHFTLNTELLLSQHSRFIAAGEEYLQLVQHRCMSAHTLP